MGSGRSAVEIADRRGAGGHLRVSWHPERRLVNVSQWRHGVCVAATPLELADVPTLVRLLVDALAEGAESGEPVAPTVTSLRRDARAVAGTWRRSLAARLRLWGASPQTGPARWWRRRARPEGPVAAVIDLEPSPTTPTPLPNRSRTPAGGEVTEAGGGAGTP